MFYRRRIDDLKSKIESLEAKQKDLITDNWRLRRELIEKSIVINNLQVDKMRPDANI